jgi:hypothetical protein
VFSCSCTNIAEGAHKPHKPPAPEQPGPSVPRWCAAGLLRGPILWVSGGSARVPGLFIEGGAPAKVPCGRTRSSAGARWVEGWGAQVGRGLRFAPSACGALCTKKRFPTKNENRPQQSFRPTSRVLFLVCTPLNAIARRGLNALPNRMALSCY